MEPALAGEGGSLQAEGMWQKKESVPGRKQGLLCGWVGGWVQGWKGACHTYPVPGSNFIPFLEQQNSIFVRGTETLEPSLLE